MQKKTSYVFGHNVSVHRPRFRYAFSSGRHGYACAPLYYYYCVSQLTTSVKGIRIATCRRRRRCTHLMIPPTPPNISCVRARARSRIYKLSWGRRHLDDRRPSPPLSKRSVPTLFVLYPIFINIFYINDDIIQGHFFLFINRYCYRPLLLLCNRRGRIADKISQNQNIASKISRNSKIVWPKYH